MKLIALTLTTALAFSVAAEAKPPKDNAKALPPGLQKQLATKGTLPPGWQKKLKRGSRLDINVYKAGKIVVPRDRDGIVTIRVEGKVIRLLEATREIVQILK